MEKKISLLGSTGSIGTQTLDVIRHLNQKGHRFEVVALAAGSNLKLLAEQIREFKPQIACLKHKVDADRLRSGKTVEILYGDEGLRQIARLDEADLLVNAVVGAIGLEPTLEAIKSNINVALANKESLVIGGHLVKESLQKSEAQIIPIDSEHSGVFQVSRGLGVESREIERIVLTASGGALREYPIEALEHVRKEQVLAHPTWQMGARITVDSATLVNKGFEVIEVHWLFDLPFDRIEVVIHPQSIVHALIGFKDGSMMAQMSAPDMRIPIQYALTYPERIESDFSALRLWPCRQALDLSFRAVDHRRYPAFGVMREAAGRGGVLPAVLNAADEVLVERFLNGEIRFTDIARGLKAVYTLASSRLDEFEPAPKLTDLWAADRWARKTVEQFNSSTVKQSTIIIR